MEKFCSVCGNLKLEDVDYCMHCHSTEFSIEKRNFFNENKKDNKNDTKKISDKTWGYLCTIAGIILLIVGIINEQGFFTGIGIFELFGGALCLFTQDGNNSTIKNIEQKEFVLVNEIFALSSSSYFGKYVAEIIKILFNSNNIYETTQTITEEAAGVTNEKIRREKIEYYVDNLDVEEITLENVKSILNKWENAKVRPEIIVERLINMLAEKNEIEKDLLEKEHTKGLTDILDNFDVAYCKNIEQLIGQANEVRGTSQEAYENKNVTGLNYGVITNSMGSAMAYDFLNNREMSKQSQQQNYKIQDNQNFYEKAELDCVYEKTMKLYENFINDIDKEIEKVF